MFLDVWFLVPKSSQVNSLIQMYSSLIKEKSALSFAHFMFNITRLVWWCSWQHVSYIYTVISLHLRSQPGMPIALASVVNYQQWGYLYFCITVRDCFDPQWANLHFKTPLWRSVAGWLTALDVNTKDTQTFFHPQNDLNENDLKTYSMRRP